MLPNLRTSDIRLPKTVPFMSFMWNSFNPKMMTNGGDFSSSCRASSCAIDRHWMKMNSKRCSCAVAFSCSCWLNFWLSLLKPPFPEFSAPPLVSCCRVLAVVESFLSLVFQVERFPKPPRVFPFPPFAFASHVLSSVLRSSFPCGS